MRAAFSPLSAWCVRVAVVAALAVAGARDSRASIIGVSAYRSMSAFAELTYTPLCMWPPCPRPPVTITDGPYSQSYTSLGAWAEDVSASVSWSLFGASASAEQDSDIVVSSESLSVSASGSVLRSNDASQASSDIQLYFTLDGRQYSYDLRVLGNYWGFLGSFASGSSTGVLDPGNYYMGFVFRDDAELGPSDLSTPYLLNLQLTPYSAPATPVTEPTSVLLIAAGLAAVAWRRRCGV
jgi:hypothetical protein